MGKIIVILFIIIQILSWILGKKKKRKAQGDEGPKETPFQKFIKEMFAQATGVDPASKSSMSWDEFMEDDEDYEYDEEEEPEDAPPPPPPIPKKAQGQPRAPASADALKAKSHRKALRRAVIWSEILAPPVGLQNRD